MILDTGVVVIGRNEGPRLGACVRSALREVPAAHVVYVDSGSTDGSVALARRFGVMAVELAAGTPFTAARARNAGAARLLAERPQLAFLMFVDGDCELVEGFLGEARAYLLEYQRVGVVCGRRREREATRNVYHRMTDMEWDTPVGEAREFGGDALIRVTALLSLCGELTARGTRANGDAAERGLRFYRETMIAGEEPELAVRLRRNRWFVVRLDREMTRHDIRMTRFGQWWKRAVRSGHATAERAFLHGSPPERDGAKQRRSLLCWGVLVPAAAVGAAAALRAPWVLGLWPLAYGALAWRVYRHMRKRRMKADDARLYAAFCVAAKVPEVLGLLRFYVERWRGRPAYLIEYHASAVPRAQGAAGDGRGQEVRGVFRAAGARHAERPGAASAEG